MSVKETTAVMMAYFNSEHSDVSMMAEDVVFTTMADGQETRTPAGVLRMLGYFYQMAFQATAEPRNLIFSENHAVWEGEFVGTHTGDFAGIPATGNAVRVPLCIVYDVANGKIQRARIYLEMPVLFQQIGAQAAQHA